MGTSGICLAFEAWGSVISQCSHCSQHDKYIQDALFSHSMITSSLPLHPPPSPSFLPPGGKGFIRHCISPICASLKSLVFQNFTLRMIPMLNKAWEKKEIKEGRRDSGKKGPPLTSGNFVAVWTWNCYNIWVRSSASQVIGSTVYKCNGCPGLVDKTLQVLVFSGRILMFQALTARF